MKTLVLIFLSIFLSIAISCKKDNLGTDPNNNGNDTIQLRYISLVADSNSIPINGTVGLTVTANGYNLTYNWVASEGTILGSGSKVVYTICHATVSHITCTIKDGHNKQDSKTIDITSH